MNDIEPTTETRMAHAAGPAPDRPLRVRVVGTLEAGVAERITSAYPNVQLEIGKESGGPAEVMYLLFDSVRYLSAVVSALPEPPKWVQLRAAGIPPQVVEALRAMPGTVLTNSSGAYGSAIAEYVLAVILAHLKRLREMHAAQQQRAWQGRMQLDELRGRTVGILGAGDIGQSTARLLEPFGVRLLGVRRGGAPTPGFAQVYTPARLHEFLAQLDVLIVTAPLTRETQGMLGAAELAALPAGAFLVNVGRGAILDEAALVAALQRGHLSGAALDVFVAEPLPPTSPLWGMPNVFISPHCSDNTPTSSDRVLAMFLANLGRYLRGEPLENVVDLDQGY